MKKLFLLLLTTFIISCSTDDSSNNPVLKLPPETQTGANTFGCIIDGKILIPRSGNTSQINPLSGARLTRGYPAFDFDYLELKIIDHKSRNGSILFFHIHDAIENGIGNYVIDESNGFTAIDGLEHHYLYCDVYSSKTNSYQRYMSSNNSGTFTITRFTLGSENTGTIISGKFTCKVRNINDPTDEIEITDGRFDINSLTVALTYFP
jgi:hypothetical protein